MPSATSVTMSMKFGAFTFRSGGGVRMIGSAFAASIAASLMLLSSSSPWSRALRIALSTVSRRSATSLVSGTSIVPSGDSTAAARGS